MLRSIGLTLAALLALSAAPAGAAPTGVALGVDPQASAERKDGTVTLAVGADIFIGDRVVTGAAGLVQIVFDDTTRLVVGPNSALVIEDYLLREDGSAGRLAVDALSGTFRFISGKSPKDSYVVTTPTGTIGVRGTAYDFFVTQLVTSILLYSGALEFCATGGDCAVLENMCDVGQFTETQALLFGDGGRLSQADRDDLRAMFIYAVSQLPLLTAFRLDDVRSCVTPRSSAPGSPALDGAEDHDAPYDPADDDDNSNSCTGGRSCS